MEQNKFWQSIGEFNNSAANQQKAQHEFNEELPFEADDNGLNSTRRDFLKYLGFSTAAATLAASCEMPVKKAIPFTNKPENITPGVAQYYATTYVQDGDVVSVLAKVRDGRPIKIEGNDLSPLYGGGTSARAQASVLDLYDNSRLRHPRQKAGADFKEVPSFDVLDKAVMAGLAANGPIVLLTSSIVSPSTKQIITEFLAKYPGSRHVQYDAVSYSGMLQANEASFGKRMIPGYQFDKAKVIVSLAADFLGTWLSPVEFARQYAVGRRVDEKNPAMSKHYQFESNLSMTGANADERFSHRPSETGAVAVALLNAVAGAAVSGVPDNIKAAVAKVAADLNANKGAAVVVSGSNDPAVQTVVNAINSAIGANGTTIDFGTSYNVKQGIDADMATLLADMEAGKVGSILIAGANPVYTHAAGDKFAKALAKVKLSVSFSSKMDETTKQCGYVIPDHHYLESWGDAEPKSGFYSFQQPTIHPLFKTRQWQDSLLKWGAATTDYLGYLKAYWTAKMGATGSWDAALRDGVVNTAASAAAGASFNAAAVANATAKIASNKIGKGMEVVLYEKTSLGTGSQANNPWLQEMPDPITKATWDNYAVMSVATYNKMFGVDLRTDGDGDAYEVTPAKNVVEVTVNGKKEKFAALAIPGVDANTIAIAVGYGCDPDLGKAAAGAGKNAYPFAGFDGTNVTYSADATATAIKGETYVIAQTQVHNVLVAQGVKRKEVLAESSLATFKKHPNMFYAYREELSEDFAEGDDFRKEATIYPDFAGERAIHWGMQIDLNTCTGCGACVVACNAENNIAVVGKTEVSRFHDMHWLRIDRYFVSDEKNPDDVKDVIFQPMMCQHCDNAPCENVCPVAATNHSSEGLNQMTYNRCIGTRYCANNCPYKVRRFNWADYTGADSFPDNQEGVVSDASLMMGEDLTRMVLNPDVTVRSRGVIEKCSFCVQRLQEGKLTAKKQSRPLEDKDVKTACQQACPTSAIVFGNQKNKESVVAKSLVENKLRTFYSLEMLHVLPNVSYMAKLRNTDDVEEVAHHGAAKAEAHVEEHKGATHPTGDSSHKAEGHVEEKHAAEAHH
jgi:MoCo/4Fe-4S cofactor protein with predicted Tat translocation signal